MQSGSSSAVKIGSSRVDRTPTTSSALHVTPVSTHMTITPSKVYQSKSTPTVTPDYYKQVHGYGTNGTPRSQSSSKNVSSKRDPTYKQITHNTIPKFTVDTPFDDVPHDNGTSRGLELEEMHSSIVVAVRVRPLVTPTASDGSNLIRQQIKSILKVEKNTVIVDDIATNSGGSKSTPAKLQTFSYDHCLWSGDQHHPQYADQQKVYEVVAQPLLDKAFEGYNACIFAYGQTGSGKSYSVMGRPDDAGIIPRFSQDLFERVQVCEKRNERVCIEISFFEIYNEKIHDLLASSVDQSKKAPIKIREHSVLGPYVVGLSTFVVTCHDDLASWLSLGNKQRATAATVMNEKSSRSHSVFTIVVTRVQSELIDGELHEHSRRSKINIVDLAGSERADTNQTQLLRLKEGASINKSLLTLGRVIAQLSEAGSQSSSSTPNGFTGAAVGRSSRKTFVPYRDSVLTWLLKESLGGNSQTTMLATVSPSNTCLEETLSTLRYARQARSIVNVVHINEDPKARLIRELRAEIEKLRGHQQVSYPKNAESEIQQLQKKLKEKELLLKQTTTSLQEKLDQATKSKAQGEGNLQKVGVALAINNELPNLVNLNEDPQLSEALVYVLRKGSITVGRMKSGSQRDIQLKGSLIAEYHCTITNMENAITLIPNTKGQTFVNGHRIKEPTHLHHGDRIVLGGEHYFRLNFSAEMNGTDELSKLNKSGNLKDFAFARAELLRIQEARMSEELERARQKTRKEMLEEIETIKTQANLDLSMQRHGYEDRIKELVDALEHNIQSEKTKWELEAEKNLLELEVLTERRRSAANQTLEQSLVYSPVKTNFLDLIQNIADADISVFRPGTQEGCLMLYELDMMIQEANSLSRNLGRHLKFVQFDQLVDKEFVVVIRVTDEEKNMNQDWPVETFVERLQIIRRISEGEIDLELFNTDGIWSEDNFPMSLTTKDKETVHGIKQLKACANLSLMESFDSPSLVVGNSRKSLLDGRSLVKDQSSINPLVLCSDQCSTMMQCFSEFSNSNFQVDICKLLTNLNELECRVTDLNNVTKSSQWPFSLNLLLFTLLMRASKLLPTSPTGNRVKSLASQFSKVIQDLGDSVTATLLGVTANSDHDVLTATNKLKDSILECGNLIGQLSISLGLTMDPDRSPLLFEVNTKISHQFLLGVESVVRQVFSNAVDKVDTIELRMKVLNDDSYIMNASKGLEVGTLIPTCRDSFISIKSWIDLYRDATMATSKRRTECSVGRLVHVCNQSQQMCVNLSLLIEAIINLCDDVEVFVRGEHVDFKETLILMGEIHGSVDTLMSISEIHFITPSSSSPLQIKKISTPELQRTDALRSKTQTVEEANRKLKKIIRQIGDSQRLSSRSSGDSPMMRLSQSPRKPQLSEDKTRPRKCGISNTSDTQSKHTTTSYRGDDTSVWDSSFPNFGSYTCNPLSPTEFGLLRSPD